MRKILWDFEIQIDPLIPTRRPGLVIIYFKKSLGLLIDFDVPTDHRGKIKEREKRERNWKREKVLGACHVIF